MFDELGIQGLDFRLDPIASRRIAPRGGHALVLGLANRRIEPLAIDGQIHTHAQRIGVLAVGNRAEPRRVDLVPVHAQGDVGPIVASGQGHGRLVSADLAAIGIQLGLRGLGQFQEYFGRVGQILAIQLCRGGERRLRRHMEHGGQLGLRLHPIVLQLDQVHLQLRQLDLGLPDRFESGAGDDSRACDFDDVFQSRLEPAGFRDGVLQEVEIEVGPFYLLDHAQFRGGHSGVCGHRLVPGHVAPQPPLAEPGKLLREAHHHVLRAGRRLD